MRAVRHERRRSSSGRAPVRRRAAAGLPADGLDPTIEAAAMLFETRGYDETTMTEVAERAGVGRQTVHARYGGKPGLLAAIVVEFCGGFVRHVLRSGADTDSGSRLQDHPTGLAQLAAAMRDYAALRGPLVRVALSARDLPWLARATAPARCELEQLLTFQFRSTRPSHEVLCLATELLACVARSEGGGASRVIGVPNAWRTAALLQELASAPAAQQETG